MTYSDNIIEKSGVRSLRIAVPCFSGDDDFAACSRMNSFYSSAAGDIYSYAVSLLDSAERRARYSCVYTVVPEGEQVSVVLHLSYSASNERSRRRTVTHVWKNGNIVSRSVE